MRYAIVVMFLVGCDGYTDYQYYEHVDSGVKADLTEVKSAHLIPANLSWAEIDTNGDGKIENYITAIKDQPCLDCYIYAATGLYEIQYKIEHKVEVNVDLSEQNIHNCLRLACYQGGNPYHVLKYIQSIGVVEESVVPTGNWEECNNCKETVGWLRQDQINYFKFKKISVLYPPKIPYDQKKQKLITALQNGPVAIAIMSWYGYGYNSKGNMECVDGSTSSHSVVVVGYENYGDVFLIKNSHGDGKLLRMEFEGGDKCGFAINAMQISGTYAEYGAGEKFCNSRIDSDKDGIEDPFDNCPRHKNPKQENFDGDHYGDACDLCPLWAGHPKDGCTVE